MMFLKPDPVCSLLPFLLLFSSPLLSFLFSFLLPSFFPYFFLPVSSETLKIPKSPLEQRCSRFSFFLPFFCLFSTSFIYSFLSFFSNKMMYLDKSHHRSPKYGPKPRKGQDCHVAQAEASRLGFDMITQVVYT